MRKKVICLVLVMMLILGTMGSTALASGHRPKSVISTDIWYDINRVINLEYERSVNRAMSLYVAPFVAPVGITILGTKVGTKIYFLGTAPEGLSVGALGEILYKSVPGAPETVFTVGANIGYKYFITDMFTVEARGGLEYAFGLGLLPSLGINVGIGL